MGIESVRLGEGGRVVIPSDVRKKLQLEVGDELILTVENGAIKLLSRKQAFMAVHEQLAVYLPKDESLADELIEDRRRQARDE